MGTATSPAGIGSSRSADSAAPTAAGRWFFPSGWTDRTVDTSVDYITIKVSVASHGETQTQYINEIVTTTVDSVMGTTTQQTVSEQATVSQGAPIAAATASSGTLTESVTIADRRTTTQTTYASSMPTKAEVNNVGEPISTVHTETVSTAGSVAEQLAASKPVAVAEVDDATIAQTLNELATYLSKNANLSRLLQGPNAPTFINASV